MGGFKDYLAGLRPIPKETTDAQWRGYPAEAPPRGEVKNPLYHRNATKVWGQYEHEYLAPRGVNWDDLPTQEIETKHLISPQKQLDVSHLDSMPEHEQRKPIMVTRTKSGQHIIINGNHRAVIAHGTTGKIMARIFQSKR